MYFYHGFSDIVPISEFLTHFIIRNSYLCPLLAYEIWPDPGADPALNPKTLKFDKEGGGGRQERANNVCF